MFCSSRHRVCLALLGFLFFTSCSRQAGKAPELRIAILRFENLGADASADWIGRALSELLIEQLAGQPDLYAISSSTLHASARSAGPRPSRAPGVSAENSLAVLAGANRIGYGDFAVREGRLEATLFLEDVPSRQYAKVISASAGPSDVIAVANALARQIAPRVSPSLAHNNQAVRDYVDAIEGSVPADMLRDDAAAIAADPDFTPPYRLLAEWKVQQHDTPAALALLEQAAPHAFSPLERARIHLESAVLRSDAADRRKALAELADADPGNPNQWGVLAEARFSAHQDAEAAAAFRKQLALDPDNRNSLNQLGYAEANAGNLPAGIEALRRYQALSPGDSNPIDSLGDIHLAAGRLREAEELYLAAYRKNPKFLDGGDLFKAAMARLMTGDIAGATELNEKYLKTLSGNAARLSEIERAEWNWTSGRRQPAYRQMLAFAQSLEGEQREYAARCYAELSMWSLLLGDRAAAAQMARKALTLPGVPVSAAAVVAQFLTLPPAPASEWTARAAKLFPDRRMEPVPDLSLACALLLNQEYQPAVEILKKLYTEGVHTPVDEGIPVMLAWALLETGRSQEAASLLRNNPIPPPTGFTVFTPFYFPRLYYLRGRLAEKSAYRLFLQLSGPTPLIWGEEQKAQLAIH